MTAAAFALVVAAAVIHAAWNLVAKRAGGGVVFVWLFATAGSLLYAPLAAAVAAWQRPHIGAAQLMFVAGTAALHLAYFLLLQRGYRLGDLSLVYPLARGTGPILATAAAVAFLGERPGPVGLAGAGLIGGGIMLLATGRAGWRRPNAGRAALYALLTGVFIAAYTLWDKRAVTAAAIPPVLLDWGGNVGRVALLAPAALARRATMADVWRQHRREILLVAALSPLSYILVLSAMTFTAVSYVAPAREISILIGVLMGAHLLKEGDTGRRVAAAGAMAAGLIALVVS